MSNQHHNCCAKCLRRTDTPKLISTRRKIQLQWLIDYFLLINVDSTYHKYICYRCYKMLISKKKEDHLYSQAILDKQKTEKSHIKNKFLIEKQFLVDITTKVTSKQMYSLSGLGLKDFIKLYDFLIDKWKHKFDLKNLLAFYLIKLRLGVSTNKVSNFLPIANEKTIYRYINILRAFLVDNFVSKTLGIGNISRKEINQKHTTNLSRLLFDLPTENIITVWDGTYVYIEKSSNYTFQKETYSMHKGRHLVKMMMVVSTTG